MRCWRDGQHSFIALESRHCSLENLKACTDLKLASGSVQVEKDEHYIRSVVSMCATAEEIINQNNAIDIYEEYWADLDDISALDTEPASMSIITQLKDSHAATARRPVQSVSWHPDGSQKVSQLLVKTLDMPQALHAC